MSTRTTLLNQLRERVGRTAAQYIDVERSATTPERLLRTRISWEPLLSARAARRRLRVAEVPGDEPPRIGGERKLRVVKWGLAYFYQVIRDFFLWR